MKIGGHPLHSMLIHFPTALLPMDLLLSYLSYQNHNEHFSYAAFYCLVLGTLGGLVAILTGLLDLIRIPKSIKPALSNGLIHGFLNLLVICIYSMWAWKQYKTYPNLQEPSTGLLIFKLIMMLVLLAGNYLGGTLVYKYLIGTSQNQNHDRD